MARPLDNGALALYRALANQGVTDALTDAVTKRIRMANVLSVCGASLMVASGPFVDVVEAVDSRRGQIEASARNDEISITVSDRVRTLRRTPDGPPPSRRGWSGPCNGVRP
jgi:hypothetical protein